MNVENVLKQTRGRFAAITFVRSTTTKNGSAGDTVKRTFRTGVRKHTNGVGLKFDPKAKGIVTLWCKKGYRGIKLDNIVSVKCGEIQWNR
jgi:hypothetical protein